jgi:hypothetical protein
MKQIILGTFLGKFALVARDKCEIIKTTFINIESLGTISNDQMATFLVTRLCKPNKIFVDIGAHIGSIISAVTYHDSTIKIIAAEAVPEKALSFRCKFPSVDVYEYAVGDPGDEEETVSFYTKEDIWDFLNDNDYGVFVPNRVAHNGVELSKDGWLY